MAIMAILAITATMAILAITFRNVGADKLLKAHNPDFENEFFDSDYSMVKDDFSSLI